ncbi:MAG TPA: GGDEF domain-containing protein, partial [Euzebya sp.]|nr:GGDEF domain-containing protein [Euzebya sp.]
MTVAATAVALLPPGPVVGPGWVVAALVGGFFAAEVATTHVRHGTESESFSLSEVPLAIGLLVLGPLGLIGSRMVGSGLALVLDRHQRGEKLVFNLVMWSAQAAVASAMVIGFAGQDRTSATAAYALLLSIALTDAMSAVAINGIIANVRDQPAPLGALIASVRAGLPPALAAAAFGFVLVRTVSGDWVLAGPLALIGLSIWLALRAQTGLLAEQDGLRRVASLGSVVLSPDLDENASVGQLLATVADLLDATVVGLRVTEPCGEQVVFTTDDRAHALLADLATVGQPRVLAPHECAGGAVRDGLVVPLPADAPVTGTLLVADTVGASAVLGAVDLRVAISLAGQLATMVHNARLNGTVREQAQQARWEARHDSLTGLPNRLWMGEHLRRQPADRPYSILLLDLDGFKSVNDALGHSSGDDLLIDFARRLQAIVPEDVIATRFAGDEFVCLVPGPVQRGMAVAVMAREHFQTASSIRGIRLSVTPSVGFAHHPTDATDPEELLRAADVAMFRAKEDGSGVARFVVTDAEKAARKLRLGVELREAVNDERLTCVYQ